MKKETKVMDMDYIVEETPEVLKIDDWWDKPDEAETKLRYLCSLLDNGSHLDITTNIDGIVTDSDLDNDTKNEKIEYLCKLGRKKGQPIRSKLKLSDEIETIVEESGFTKMNFFYKRERIDQTDYLFLKSMLGTKGTYGVTLSKTQFFEFESLINTHCKKNPIPKVWDYLVLEGIVGGAAGVATALFATIFYDFSEQVKIGIGLISGVAVAVGTIAFNPMKKYGQEQYNQKNLTLSKKINDEFQINCSQKEYDHKIIEPFLR